VLEQQPGIGQGFLLIIEQRDPTNSQDSDRFEHLPQPINGPAAEREHGTACVACDFLEHGCPARRRREG
jgi:hypothetical protein